mmetsp:Transcript_27694/g.40884  ORF Transcript_27694/g.40884 Transcript_27694/m.40884 type:complete len:85 (-) Transcript_27694:55-309(-)
MAVASGTVFTTGQCTNCCQQYTGDRHRTSLFLLDQYILQGATTLDWNRRIVTAGLIRIDPTPSSHVQWVSDAGESLQRVEIEFE